MRWASAHRVLNQKVRSDNGLFRVDCYAPMNSITNSIATGCQHRSEPTQHVCFRPGCFLRFEFSEPSFKIRIERTLPPDMTNSRADFALRNRLTQMAPPACRAAGPATSGAPTSLGLRSWARVLWVPDVKRPCGELRASAAPESNVPSPDVPRLSARNAHRVEGATELDLDCRSIIGSFRR